jgi:hypothetical protein
MRARMTRETAIVMCVTRRSVRSAGFAPPPGGCIRQPNRRQKLLIPGAGFRRATWPLAHPEPVDLAVHHGQSATGPRPRRLGRACLRTLREPYRARIAWPGTQPPARCSPGSRFASRKRGMGCRRSRGTSRRQALYRGRSTCSLAVARRRLASGRLQVAELVLLIVVAKASGTTRRSSLAMGTLWRR